MSYEWTIRGFTAGALLVLLALCFKMRGLSLEERRQFLLRITLGNVLLYGIYKGLLCTVADYETTIWNELPLHLCNLVTLILPYALAKNRVKLLGFCAFFGISGTVVAALTPIDGFEDISIYSVEFLYYWYHYLLLITLILLVVSGLYRGQLYHLPAVFGVYILLAVGAHLVNLLLRLGVHSGANYMYTFLVEGNPISEAFYGLIPVPLLYCVTPLLVLSVLFTGVILLGQQMERHHLSLGI